MKPMTNEEMAKRIEAHAVWMGDVHGCEDPQAEAELTAIARRIRLLGAEVEAGRRVWDACDPYEADESGKAFTDARAALDADERGR